MSISINATTTKDTSCLITRRIQSSQTWWAKNTIAAEYLGLAIYHGKHFLFDAKVNTYCLNESLNQMDELIFTNYVSNKLVVFFFFKIVFKCYLTRLTISRIIFPYTRIHFSTIKYWWSYRGAFVYFSWQFWHLVFFVQNKTN